MNENYLKYKYYTSRCEMADEYKKITGEELQPLGEDWENYKKGDFKMNIEEAIDILVPKENIDLSNHFNNTRFFEAINTLLTAYEKEKGENVKLRLQDIPFIEGELKAYKDRVNELKQQLEKKRKIKNTKFY